MEESETKPHIPFGFKHFVSFSPKPSVCERVFHYICTYFKFRSTLGLSCDPGGRCVYSYLYRQSGIGKILRCILGSKYHLCASNREKIFGIHTFATFRCVSCFYWYCCFHSEQCRSGIIPYSARCHCHRSCHR